VEVEVKLRPASCETTEKSWQLAVGSRRKLRHGSAVLPYERALPCNPYNRHVPDQKRRDDAKGKAALQRAIRESAGDAVRASILEKRPYLKMAFSNPYNLSLLGGALVAAVATMNPFLAAAAIGAELLWLLHGPESKTLRRLLWDPRFEKIRLVLELQEREEKIRDLPEEGKERIRALVTRQHEITKLAEKNPSFTGDLLRTELVKTRKLVDSFIDMSMNVDRFERYLDSVDLAAIEKDRERWHARASSNRASELERGVAMKNFEVIMKRIEKLREIRHYLDVARAQLHLIENSFQLIGDQIVTMHSPAEMSGQLDDLLDGVDSIQQTQRDTEKILSAIEA
jgi:hypothetical protein